ncbi:MAG TPA: oxygen-dependent coproporphyrinogen oxidase [Polyangia bacterium]|jgi:coproporphyrinogen III oxidase|nr:oxygen-dependent coproporphyrinogen oxidase [Polyangia bacterium]
MSAATETDRGAPLVDRAVAFFRGLQDRIVDALERADGGAFRQDEWTRPGGGGGRSRVLADGALFEKAGVNFSDVHGKLRPEMSKALPGEGAAFRAAGVSLVLHPQSPRVPTTHANFRFLQRGDVAWFGGGADLTPYYAVAEDAAHFHRTLRAACARHDADFFPRFKHWCDDYFFLPHRQEPRGVGGVFFDYLGAGAEVTAGQTPVAGVARPSPVEGDPERVFAFVRDIADSFVDAYLPIVERRRRDPWGERERRWQLVRRGRYVEFNLLYDRGTVFGLRTEGRIESILMSLPPEVRWEYAHAPEPGSPEAATVEAICARRDWASEPDEA